MKESYVEGVALHRVLESCANVPRGGREALTEAGTGWVLSHEIFRIGIADLVPRKGRQHADGRYAQVRRRIPGGPRPHARAEAAQTETASGSSNDARYYPRQEPYEVIPQVRICAGGTQQLASLP